jgi:hypothetical protein
MEGNDKDLWASLNGLLGLLFTNQKAKTALEGRERKCDDRHSDCKLRVHQSPQ